MKKMISLVMGLILLSPVVLSAAHGTDATATPQPKKQTMSEIMKEDQSESTDTLAIPLDKSAEEDEMLMNKMEAIQKRDQAKKEKPAMAPK